MFGLVLEGGGTKGAYHIGAYRALLELKIPITCITGVSIGAINGAMFVQGDLEKASLMWDSISASDIIKLPKDMPEVKNLFAFKNFQTFFKEFKENKGLDISPLEKLLYEHINEDKIRSSNINFGLGTFNLTEMKEQQLFISDIPKGELVDYLVASACLPVFRKKKINSAFYMDGGITNNLPVDMLIKNGYNDILCVEVGGMGKSKHTVGAGCNIISIKSGGGALKSMDFTPEAIKEAKEMGYYDTLRALGIVMGEEYYINSVSYVQSKFRMGDKLLRGLQLAGVIFGIDRLKIYTVDELVSEVVTVFRNTTEYDSVLEVLTKSEREKTAAIARAIIRSDSEILENGAFAGILGTMFEAASAVAYFAERNGI